jgi:RNA polymerase sigma factor (TIGR02999 family)
VTPPDPTESVSSITRLLEGWREGDEEALSSLTALVYAELRRLAGAFLQNERSGHTLQPTALVHEFYLQIESVRDIDWKCRAQFFSIAARMMRNILVDHARKRGAEKRGAGIVVSLEDNAPADAAQAPDILMVDAALGRFADLYPRQAQVVELRFFGGLTAEETVEALNVTGHEVSLRTVERDWKFSRAWLQNEIA